MRSLARKRLPLGQSEKWRNRKAFSRAPSPRVRSSAPFRASAVFDTLQQAYYSGIEEAGKEEGAL
jgi:hypothetical protein